MRHWLMICALGLAAMLPAAVNAGDGSGKAPATPDLDSGHTLYTVGYAHLDTQWRWDYPEVIRDFLPATMHDNFQLFEKYPHYVFNFTGANRYMYMQEYYPDDFAKLKQYVAQGRWFPAGSSMEEGDVNVPSAESVIRHVLYGNEYFRKEFGKASAEYMLPDCFGFPASLPSLLAHCGIKGFSTQKLPWGSAVGIPFNVGVWEGLNGDSVVAALNPGSYSEPITTDLANDPDWLKRIDADGKASGVYADYHYYGTGDTGGAPSVGSARLLEQAITKGGPVRVVGGNADQMFLDLTPTQVKRLPRYKGDLLLTQHSAGSITSGSYMKRWNHENELLADSAERASVAASWLGGMAYPQRKLGEAWRLTLAGQFHDILPSTITPKGFEFAWNNEVLALNQFADVLQGAAGSVSSGLDTAVQGQPVVVYNPLSIARQDVVEATVNFPGNAPGAVHVVDQNGKAVPAQVLGHDGGATHLLFLASLPPVGFAVYDVQPSKSASSADSELKVAKDSLENARYRVSLNAAGDVAGIYDKSAGRELLSAPARLAFSHDQPGYWPSWNMDWDQASAPPTGYVDGPASVRVVEDGPVRVALEVTRQAQGSTFVQKISLAADEAGGRVEFHNTIDWRGKACNLKAIFPLSVSNPLATYNWEVGTIQRGNDDEKKYEVPSHQWIDLTDAKGDYGVTVLSPFKYGSNKPDDHTLRLTLLRTPGAVLDKQGVPQDDYADQTTLDWGRHDIVYGLSGHSADWRAGQTDWQAMSLEQPLVAFQDSKHDGVGREFSLLALSSSRVRVLALKKAEAGDEIILRLVELDGKAQPGVMVRFAGDVASAREVDGQERPLGPATVADGMLRADFSPYQLRSFAIKLAAPQQRLDAAMSQLLALPYNAVVTSRDKQVADDGFDPDGRCLAAEMLPAQLTDGGVEFKLGPVGSGKPDGLTCKGQEMELPQGGFNRAYFLASSSPGDQSADFKVVGELGDTGVSAKTSLRIQDWGGFVGQWDNRTWDGDIPETVFSWTFRLTGLEAGYTRRDPVAWFCSHRHNAYGWNEIYEYTYLYRYAIDLPPGARTLWLPDNDKIHIMAISVAQDRAAGFTPAQPLYDTLEGHVGEDFTK